MGLSRDNRLMAAALLLWGAGEGLFAYIQPLYLKQLGADPATIGAVLAVAAGVAVFFHLPAGYLADHLGRKQVLLVGWGIGLLAAVLMFAANSLPTFTLALVLYTTTMFVGGPINSYVVEARGAQSEQRALTLVSAGFWGGTIASPAVGGWIGQEFGLRWVYGAALVMFVLSCLAIFFLRPQALVPPAHGQSRYAELFTNRRFIRLMALMFFAFLGFQVGLPLMPNFVQEVRGYDVQMVGWLGTITSASTVLVNVLLGQRAPRRGFLLAQVLAFFSMAFLLMVNGWPGLALAYALRASWPLARNMANAQVRRVVSAAEIGLAFGVFETVGALALALGPWLAGQLYERSPALPFQVSLILIALAAPVVWLLAPRRAESVAAVGTSVSSELSNWTGVRMGDYLRVTRECTLDTLRPALAAALRAHMEKQGVTAGAVAACETTATKQKKGLFGGKAEVILTGVLLAPPWLIWASGKEGERPVALSARLQDLQITDYEKSEMNKLVPDTGLTLTGLRADGVELGSAFMGFGPEPAAHNFRAALKEAWAKARGA